MKNTISQLIDDFHERDLPDPVLRAKVFPEIKGKADVVTWYDEAVLDGSINIIPVWKWLLS